jgi:hypothetical protein
MEPQKHQKMPLMKKLILGANINFNSNGAMLADCQIFERILLMADGALTVFTKKNLTK